MTNWSVRKNVVLTRGALVFACVLISSLALVSTWLGQARSEMLVESMTEEARRIDHVADVLNDRLRELEAREKAVARREKELGIKSE